MALAEMNCDPSLEPFEPVPWMAYRPHPKEDDGGRGGGGDGPGDLSFCECGWCREENDKLTPHFLRVSHSSVLTESSIYDRAFVKS
jgi:hypothetical protein